MIAYNCSSSTHVRFIHMSGYSTPKRTCTLPSKEGITLGFQRHKTESSKIGEEKGKEYSEKWSASVSLRSPEPVYQFLAIVRKQGFWVLEKNRLALNTRTFSTAMKAYTSPNFRLAVLLWTSPGESTFLQIWTNRGKTLTANPFQAEFCWIYHHSWQLFPHPKARLPNNVHLGMLKQEEA